MLSLAQLLPVYKTTSKCLLSPVPCRGPQFCPLMVISIFSQCYINSETTRIVTDSSEEALLIRWAVLLYKKRNFHQPSQTLACSFSSHLIQWISKPYLYGTREHTKNKGKELELQLNRLNDDLPREKPWASFPTSHTTAAAVQVRNPRAQEVKAKD